MKMRTWRNPSTERCVSWDWNTTEKIRGFAFLTIQNYAQDLKGTDRAINKRTARSKEKKTDVPCEGHARFLLPTFSRLAPYFASTHVTHADPARNQHLPRWHNERTGTRRCVTVVSPLIAEAAVMPRAHIAVLPMTGAAAPPGFAGAEDVVFVRTRHGRSRSEREHGAEHESGE